MIASREANIIKISILWSVSSKESYVRGNLMEGHADIPNL